MFASGIVLCKDSGKPESKTVVRTIKHATAAKVAVYTSALDIAQLKNADEMPKFTSEDEHLEKVRRFLTFLFILFFLSSRKTWS